MILTNPPFGTKGANQAPDRDDFVVPTSNKQLNFVQHVMTILKPGGRAAMVVPDNVLFADQAGEVFKILMEDCDLHTVLRCPNGHLQPLHRGHQDQRHLLHQRSADREGLDLRRPRQRPKVTKKSRPLTPAHFAEFEQCYGNDPNGQSARAKPTPQTDAGGLSTSMSQGTPLQARRFKWIRDEETDDPDDLPEPEELITEAMERLQLALDDLADMQKLLQADSSDEL